MKHDESRKFLTSYLEGLQRKDWAYVIPHQDKAARLVARLYPSTAFPVLSGSYFPTSYVATQKQIIQTALVNLEDDPTLDEEPETSPWVATADELDDLANSMPENDWTAQATEAGQLVRYVNPDAADLIKELIWRHSKAMGAEARASYRQQAIAAIRGAAKGARLLGALPGTDGRPPGTVVNVNQEQTVAMTSVTITSITELLRWEDLPEEVRPSLESMQAAAEKKDKPGFMKSASEFADRAAKFPNLVDKIGDAWDWLSTLPI